MKKIFIVIISLFMGVLIVHGEEINYVYTEWFDYYPTGVEEIRIESQDRYRWFKIEDGQRIETEEYYDYLEGYEMIEGTLKTYYRVINSEFIVIGPDGELIHDSLHCRKVFCHKVYIQPYVVNEPIEEEEIINPDTSDVLYLYYYSFSISLIVLMTCVILYLVLSKLWKRE